MKAFKTFVGILFVLTLASCGNNDTNSTLLPANNTTTTFPNGGVAPGQSGWYYGNGNFCGVNPGACYGNQLYYYGYYPVDYGYSWTGWTGPYVYQNWNNFGFNGWGYYGANNYFYGWNTFPSTYAWYPNQTYWGFWAY